MFLKNQVEWALHCCSILAALPPEKRLSTKALSEFHGVPKEYLSKALQNLSNAGLIEGTLGPKGGYRLAKPADQITFLDVVTAAEGQKNTFKCSEIRGNNPCKPEQNDLKDPCAIASIMWEADEAWRNHLKSVTLADLSKKLEESISEKLLNDSANWLLNY
jgi:Rrf2 family protein